MEYYYNHSDCMCFNSSTPNLFNSYKEFLKMSDNATKAEYEGFQLELAEELEEKIKAGSQISKNELAWLNNYRKENPKYGESPIRKLFPYWHYKRNRMN